jgi:PTS system nitrogen regulatory IIA component
VTDLSDLIALDSVLPRVSAASKRTLFTALGTAAATCWGVDAKAVTTGISAREKLGTTGFGAGIAVPHCRVEGLEQVRGIFARLAQPIDFDAVDDLPVDLVFLLLSPPDAGADHLKALARVSRRLRDRALAEKLRGAGSRDALYVLLTGIDARDAA